MDDLLTFRSLNCSICTVPYSRESRSAGNNASPKLLFHCGIGICKGCFEKEMLMPKPQRKCQCKKDCHYNNNPPYFLTELLDQDALCLTPDRSGWCLAKPISIPECPVCKDKYSLTTNGGEPVNLACGHAMCKKCFVTMTATPSPTPDNFDVAQSASMTTGFGGGSGFGISRRRRFERVDSRRSDEENYSGNDGPSNPLKRCPICRVINEKRLSTKNPLLTFLEELPRMCKQLEDSKRKAYCAACNVYEQLNRLHNCLDCNLQKICSECVLTHGHAAHNRQRFVIELAEKTSDEMLTRTVVIAKRIRERQEITNRFTNLSMHLQEKLNRLIGEIRGFDEVELLRRRESMLNNAFDSFENASRTLETHEEEFEASLAKIMRTLE